MNYFIKNIHVNKVFHLENFDITINEDAPHLLITGQNGTGKTMLLNAIADALIGWTSPSPFSFVVKKGMIVLSMTCQKPLSSSDFLLAFYQAYRKPMIIEPKNPTKPNLKTKVDIRQTATSEFLNYLSDLKIQEALARNEKQIEDADRIGEWFIEFRQLLRDIYNDQSLELNFDYRDYSFRIVTGGKNFKFTELSDGYAAIIEIIADLILKMQTEGSVVRAYNREGIVIIDEIETHLHLALQKTILPYLTKVFPNIQFIVSTHSPFVLGSLSNATAFDLEHREAIDDLTEYSYEALAEGYFGVKTDSSYVKLRMDRLKALLQIETKSESELIELKKLIEDFEKISETGLPLIKGEFNQLKIRYADAIKQLEDDKSC